jgi:fido (protein-threonine AMPylation protein)
MDYIRRKTIKGNKYYYFEYPLYDIHTGKKTPFSKYIGKKIPKNIKEILEKIFKEVAEFSLEGTGQKIKKYFPPERIKHIEKSRFWYACLCHNLFEKEFALFQNLFYILFVLNSNRAEGSRVTRPDIEKILKRKKIKPRTSLDKEIINSIKAINFAFSNKMEWNVKSIKKIHKILFRNLRPDIAGEYKTMSNIAGDNIGGQIVTTTSPEKVSKEMRELVKWLNGQRKIKKYPPILALEFHWRFEAIHPFEDGNGRVGRILLNALLIKHGFMPVIFFSQTHRTYCNAISKAREGYNKKLAEYFVDQLRKTRTNIETYKKMGKIRGGSKQVGRWEIRGRSIRIY